MKPIAYGGRKLHPYEQRYENHEREALAVVAGLRHFEPYVCSNAAEIHTENSAVQ